jgi:hypothetical protein
MNPERPHTADRPSTGQPPTRYEPNSLTGSRRQRSASKALTEAITPRRVVIERASPDQWARAHVGRIPSRLHGGDHERKGIDLPQRRHRTRTRQELPAAAAGVFAPRLAPHGVSVAEPEIRVKHFYTPGVEEWEIRVTNELLAWINALDDRSKAQVVIDAIDRLAEAGPGLGRPLVDRLEGSRIHNLKELRPGSAGRTEIRILFAFDPWRSAILLIGGDKSGTGPAGTNTPSPAPKTSTRST